MCEVEFNREMIGYYFDVGSDQFQVCQTCKKRVYSVIERAILGWPHTVMVPQKQVILEPVTFLGRGKGGGP